MFFLGILLLALWVIGLATSQIARVYTISVLLGVPLMRRFDQGTAAGTARNLGADEGGFYFLGRTMTGLKN